MLIAYWIVRGVTQINAAPYSQESARGQGSRKNCSLPHRELGNTYCTSIARAQNQRVYITVSSFVAFPEVH